MKHFYTLLLVLMILMAGCSDGYDDSAVNDRLEELENRVEELEKRCQGTNADLLSLQTLVKALEGKDFITGVSPVYQDGKGTGYTICFEKAGEITIYHGKPGEQGEQGSQPQISAAKDADGIYYWTINGEWMKDPEGRKINAAGQAPQLKIEDNTWHVSYDGGKTWTLAGPSAIKGDSIFEKVEEEETEVTFILSNGEHIRLPKQGAVIPTDVMSMSHLPQTEDGYTNMHKTTGKDLGKACFNFLISPSTAVRDLQTNWKTRISMKAYYTGNGTIELLEMPVLDFQTDTETGIVSLTVSGEKLDESFYKGTHSAKAILTVTNTGSMLASEAIGMKGSMTAGLQSGTVFAKGVSLASGWYDVNKKGDGRTEYGDAVMCWAAVAANMLQWWQDRYTAAGHALPSGAADGQGKDYELAIFEKFKTDWDNMKGSQVEYGIPWYLTGEVRGRYDVGSAQPHEGTGGFFKDSWDRISPLIGENYVKEYNAYATWGRGSDYTGDPQVKFSEYVRNAFEDGMAGLSIKVGFSQIHAITLWGYEADAQGIVTKIYVTNSDDMLDQPQGPRIQKIHAYDVLKHIGNKEVGIKVCDPFNTIISITPFKGL